MNGTPAMKNNTQSSTVNSKDGVWIIDSDARTLYANSAMAEILGVDTSELIGAYSFEYVFPEDLEAAKKLFETKRGGDVNPFHFRLRRRDGSEVWVDVQGTPMRNMADEFIGIVGTFAVANGAVRKRA
jgi:PAS domain S-box-containing protein